MNYRAPSWLPGGHFQTIWPALYARRNLIPHPPYRRERWATPDADFVDVDWVDGPQNKALMVMFHGLEGSSGSHYARAFAAFAGANALSFAVAHFRGCSGELNLAPRAYHSGDHEEIGWILARFKKQHRGPIVAIGVSLGGNALLRWAQEAGTQAVQDVAAIAAVSAPIDLAAGGNAMGRGFNRLVYNRMFLNTMVPKALRKLDQYPGLFDKATLLQARDLHAFDNVFTAPLHGFRNTEDYWSRASAKPRLKDIALPALVLNARNDPFVPAWSLPSRREAGPQVTLWQPAAGGHVGFAQGGPPGHVRMLPETVGPWLLQFTNITRSFRHG
ncbi:MAG: alpha/beta hydrolase [Rhodoferax sp.]|nr:alpha/beta hydrolase [Rhodoferax sp.]MCF8211471.1 alpha/beta hydrolase [Rhodoferax sp.]